MRPCMYSCLNTNEIWHHMMLCIFLLEAKACIACSETTTAQDSRFRGKETEVKFGFLNRTKPKHNDWFWTSSSVLQKPNCLKLISTSCLTLSPRGCRFSFMLGGRGESDNPPPWKSRKECSRNHVAIYMLYIFRN